MINFRRKIGRKGRKGKGKNLMSLKGYLLFKIEGEIETRGPHVTKKILESQRHIIFVPKKFKKKNKIKSNQIEIDHRCAYQCMGVRVDFF